MKVGTDGVLLGAWCGVENLNSSKTILDIGCGTGLLALMLAQRSGADRIEAVDIDSGAVTDAEENFAASPWSDRLFVHLDSIQHFAQTASLKYDLIVSNPPYFQQDLRAPDPIRSQARHAHTLTQEDLADCVVRLLNEAGRFAVIFPTDQAIAFETIVRKYDLFAIRKLFVRPTPSSPVRRVLAEYSFQSAPSSIEELVIESEGRHGYSEQYRALTRDFYLKF